MFIAIKDETTGYSQPLLDHLNKVADLSHDFAKDFNLSDQAFVLGYLHDIGKYSKEFQKQLSNSSNITMDYSIAGAIELFHKFYSDKDLLPFAKILGMIITGHNNGLLDLGTNQDLDNGTHESKFKKYHKDYYNGFGEIDESLIKIYKDDLNEKINKSLEGKQDIKITGFAWQMIIRMLYSCTVDADITNTEIALKKEDSHKFKSIHTLSKDIDKYIKEKFSNKKKPEIIKKSQDASDNKPNLFALIAPQSQLRFLSSITFGIKHAIKNDLKRIIYVLPNDRAVEGVGKTFKDILGKESILEHFCDFTNNEKLDFSRRYKIAIEDWNVPIIVTNGREFFETCFSDSFIKLRKLHNISNSLVIFEDIQMMPLDYLNPCFALLSELIVNYNSSILFSSSTSLDFNENLHEKVQENKIDIIKDIEKNYDTSREVKFTYLNDLSNEELIKKLRFQNNSLNSLCVVNTDLQGKKLYEKIKGQGVFYLNGLLTPFDRKNKLKDIENSLKNNKECIVISTEATEDSLNCEFDFIYRDLSGIDSLFRTASRCKKELFVFKSKTSLNTKHIESIIEEYGDKTLTLEAIDEYFRLVYTKYYEKNKFDEMNIRDDFIIKRNQMKFNFRSCSNNFKFSGNKTYNIIIQEESIGEIINGIKEGNITKEDLRKIQQYCVNVYEPEFLTLIEKNALQFYNGFIFLEDSKLYNNELGLNIL